MHARGESQKAFERLDPSLIVLSNWPAVGGASERVGGVGGGDANDERASGGVGMVQMGSRQAIAAPHHSTPGKTLSVSFSFSCGIFFHIDFL